MTQQQEGKPFNPTIIKDMAFSLKDQVRALTDSIEYDLGEDLIISHLNDIEITTQKIKDKMIEDANGYLNEGLNNEIIDDGFKCKHSWGEDDGFIFCYFCGIGKDD